MRTVAALGALFASFVDYPTRFLTGAFLRCLVCFFTSRLDPHRVRSASQATLLVLSLSWQQQSSSTSRLTQTCGLFAGGLLGSKTCVVPPNRCALDEERSRELWDVSANLLKLPLYPKGVPAEPHVTISSGRAKLE